MAMTLVNRLAKPNFARFMSSSVKPMNQVNVDSPNVQKDLGDVHMNLIRKAEKLNLVRAQKHIQNRKRDWTIGGSCFAIAFAIYFYTIWAIKQETFLDDFEVPAVLPDEDDLVKK